MGMQLSAGEPKLKKKKKYVNIHFHAVLLNLHEFVLHTFYL